MVLAVVLVGAILLLLRREHAGPRPQHPMVPGAGPAGASSPVAAAPSEAGTRAAVSLDVQPGARARRVAGRVTDGTSPIAGARVRLQPRMRGGFEASAASSGDGGFDLGEVPPARYLLVADRDGAAPATLTLDLRDPAVDSEHLTLVLDACRNALAGTVRDASGGPIAAARIENVELDAVIAGVVSGADGTFELCLPRGRAFIEVRAEGYGGLMTMVAVEGRTPRDFSLSPEATITGKTVDKATGAPLAGVAVTAFQSGILDGNRPARGVATSARDGRFAIAGLVPGIYGLVANGPLRRGLLSDVSVKVGEARDVLIELDAVAPVSGRVVSSGRPVAGAAVEMAFQSAVSQEDGSFMLAGVSPGEVTVRVLNHRLLRPESVHVDAGGAREVLLEVAPLASIRGRVTRAGKPVADAEVTWSPFTQMRGPFPRSGADGEFLVDGLDAGSYRLTAAHSDSGSFSAPALVNLAEGEHKEGVELELVYAARISGVVVDDKAAPVPDVFVSFTGPDDWGRGRSDAQGRFTVDSLAGDRDYTPSVSRSEHGPSAFTFVGERPVVHVTGPEGHVDGVRLVVRRAELAIKGVVKDGAGAVVADAHVSARRSEGFGLGESAASMMTGVDGRFLLGALPPGSYLVTATGPDGAEVTAQGVEAGREDLVLTLAAVAGIDGTLEGFADRTMILGILAAPSAKPKVAQASNGRFSFRGLSPGHWTVHASAAGGQSDLAEVDVTAGAVAKVALKNRGSGSLTVTVRERGTGAPVAGHRCRAVVRTRDEGVLLTLADGNGTTDATGTATFVVPGGDLFVRCALEGGDLSDASGPTSCPPGGTAKLDLEAVRRRAGAGTIGASLDPVHAIPRVQQVRPDGAAAAAGLAVGDRILAVDGLAVNGLGGDAVMAMILDRPTGSRVTLTVEGAAGKRNVVVEVRAG